MNWLRTIWEYRYFIATSVRSDFKGRVSRSRLGFIWLVIAPLSQVVIYALVLSSLMTTKLPQLDSAYSYSIYLTAGFQGWFLFLEIVNRSLTMFIEHANVLKKIAFPRIAIPLIVVISSLINNAIFMAILLVFYSLAGLPLWPSILWLPVITIVNVMFASGIGMIVGILNVFIRDVGQMVQIALQFLFWLTPIVYTLNILPPKVQFLIYLNPLFWVIDCYHQVLAYSQAPNLSAVAIIFVGSVFMLAIGFMLFRKANAEMVDVL